MDWITVRFYSLNSIVGALQNKTNTSDSFKLQIFNKEKKLKYSNAIVVGGGPNAVNSSKAVKEFILQNKDDFCIIHSSTRNSFEYADVDVDQYYSLIGNEGHRFEKVVKDKNKITGCCILPPSPRVMGTYIPDFVKSNVFELEEITFTDKYIDSHFSLCLQITVDLGIENVYMVGFDGYNGIVPMSPKEKSLMQENESIIESYLNFTKKPLISVTPTAYNKFTQKSLFSFLG